MSKLSAALARWIDANRRRAPKELCDDASRLRLSLDALDLNKRDPHALSWARQQVRIDLENFEGRYRAWKGSAP